MRKSWLTGPLGTIAIFGVAGIAFAAWTSSASITGSVSDGVLGPLTWGTPGDTPGAGNQATAVCSAGTADGTSTWYGISGSNIAPGDECTWTDVLTNPGSVAGTLSYSGNGWFSTDTSVCPTVSATYSFSDGTQSSSTSALPSGTTPIGAGGSVTVTISMELNSAASQGCEGATFNFGTVVVTGTAA